MELELLSPRHALIATALVACAPTPAAAPAEPRPVASTPESAPPMATTEPTPAAPVASGDAGADAADASTSASTSASTEPPPLPQGTTILHIGDSMAGALGVALNDELKRAGVKGVLRFKTASFIPTWAWSQDLPVLLAGHKPDLVLITLGANEVAIKDPEIRTKVIQKLVGRLNGVPCVWIAPPLWAGDTGLLPVIRKNCAPCRYMDTNVIAPGMPRLSDKIHPTMSARKDWAKIVIDWLARERDPNGKTPWQLKPEPAAP